MSLFAKSINPSRLFNKAGSTVRSLFSKAQVEGPKLLGNFDKALNTGQKIASTLEKALPKVAGVATAIMPEFAPAILGGTKLLQGGIDKAQSVMGNIQNRRDKAMPHMTGLNDIVRGALG